MAKDYSVREFVLGEEQALAAELLDNLRTGDALELEAYGVDSKEVLIQSLLDAKECQVYRDMNGRLLCIAGVGEEYGDMGHSVWLLGTKLLNSYHREILIVHAPKAISTWLKRYGKLGNMIHGQNIPSLRWLKWLGAEMLIPLKNINTQEWFWLFKIEG